MPRSASIALRARARTWLRVHAAESCLAFVVVIALLLRVDAALRVEYPTVDGVHYMDAARTLARDGRLPFSTFPPGWPLLIHAALRVHGSDHAAHVLLTAQGWNVVLGTLAGVLVFVLVRRRSTGWWALLAAGVFLLLPETITASSSDLSEMSYVVALLGAWLVFERRSSWIAGVLFGFAYLVRPEALLVFTALCVNTGLRTRRVPIGALLGCLLLVLPYVVFMHAETGSWMLSSKNAFLDDAVGDRSLVDLARQWGRNVVVLAAPLSGVIGWPLVVLAAIGIGRRRDSMLLALLPLLLLPFFTFRMEARYWIPVLPFLFAFAVIGSRWLIDRRPRQRALLSTAIVLLVLGGAERAARDDWRYLGASFEFYPGMRDVGLWLGPQITRGDVVADYKPYVAFWSGAAFRKLPRGRDAGGIVDWARENGLEYLVVNQHLVGSLTPELAPLLGELPESVARKLRLVRVVEVEGQPRQTTLLYRVEPVGQRRAVLEESQ